MTNRWQQVYEKVQALLASENAVRNATVYPRWSPDSRVFWYERQLPDGDTAFCMVEASNGHAQVVFTLQEVGRLLNREPGICEDTGPLRLRSLDMSRSLHRATFSAFGGRWQLDQATRTLARIGDDVESRWAVSPDGRTALFVRDFNLWARELASEEEKPVTSDGAENHSYADVPMAFRPFRARLARAPEGCWSPDSRFFFTLQTDERHVPDFPLIDYVPLKARRPVILHNPTSLPGDLRPAEYRLVAIEIAAGRQVEARYSRLPAVRMNDTPFAAGLVWWHKSGKTAYFVDMERGEQRVSVNAFDVETGRCQTVFVEESATYVELGVSVYAHALVEHLAQTNELIWYSERTGRGHLYLYDLDSGECKNAITSGNWQVREILHIDAVRREVAIRAGGIMESEDPYLCKPCIASLDGGAARVLSSEPGDHIIWRSGELSLMILTLNTGMEARAVSGFSPDGNYFVETIGAVDRLPVTALRDRTGRTIAQLEAGEDRGLPVNWRWPEPFSVKAADGLTDIYGVFFKPPDMKPGQRYPIIDVIYGGPQMGHVPKTAFVQLWQTRTLIELASLAELGAFAFVVDGRGTAEREREFRTASYGALETASNLDDHVTTIHTLAKRYPQIDLDCVGITGFSGGGYMAAMAACRYGDLFKVSVACSGNFDQSLFWLGWGERYQGRFANDLYERQAVKTYVAGLKGKFLFIHGLLDWSVHPAAAFQLTQSLIDANKDFDMLILPRAAHEIPSYAIRRRLDYFVRHLFGEEPQTDIVFTVDRHAVRMLTEEASASPLAQ